MIKVVTNVEPFTEKTIVDASRYAPAKHSLAYIFMSKHHANGFFGCEVIGKQLKLGNIPISVEDGDYSIFGYEPDEHRGN